MIKTDTRKSFIELCIGGDVSPSDIDRFVREWHESDSHESLAEYLGMTHEEYASWVETPSALKHIIAVRK